MNDLKLHDVYALYQELRHHVKLYTSPDGEFEKTDFDRGCGFTLTHIDNFFMQKMEQITKSEGNK